MGKHFEKKMSKTDVVFLAVGAMIGWGWVVLSGEWIVQAGFLGAVIAFVVGGGLVCLVGLTYAELSSAMRETGGGLIFVLRAFGEKWGFIAAWSVLVGYVSVITFEAVALPTVIDYLVSVNHLGHLWTLNEWPVYLTWVMIGSGGAVLLTFLNYIGAKPAAVFQNVFTVLMIVTGILLLFGAGFNGNHDFLQPMFMNGTTGIIAVLVMVPFLFVGFDVVPQVAKEINAEPRTVSRILVSSILCAIVFYLFVVYGVAVAMDKPGLAGSQLATADAMVALFGHQAFGTVLVAGGVAGIVTSWNAFIIGGSRIMYAMAEKGMIPKWFGHIHPRFGTPTNAILFLGVLAFVAPFMGRPALVWILNAVGVGMVIGYLLVALAFLKLRKSEPDMERPYRVKYGRLVGVSAAVCSALFLCVYLPTMPAALLWPFEWGLVIVWVLLGIGLFTLQKRLRRRDEAARREDSANADLLRRRKKVAGEQNL